MKEYGDSVKKEFDALVEDYGYFDTFPDGRLCGRSSLLIENMAVFPKQGKKEQFVVATKKLNLYLEPSSKIKDGQKRECFVFESNNLPGFKQMIREVVKSREKEK